MIISMLFASQIILLVIGFGIGYWLLITANEREGYLRVTGETLGWILIVATAILALANFTYAVTVANGLHRQEYCPINRPTQQQGIPVTNPGVQTETMESPEENEKSIKPSTENYNQ